MNRKCFILAALMLIMPMMMSAQTLKGSYFLDNSMNRNKLNPAFAPKYSYFQIPGVGNTTISVTSNLGMSTFLYPLDGQLVTFLHKGVSVDRFDAALAANPYMDEQADVNLINFGWAGKKAFWTVDIGIRANADVDTSRDFYMFLKKGMETPGRYNLGPIRGNLSSAIHASLGYSRDLSDIVPGLSVGARIRGILPIVYADVNLNDVYLDAASDKWTLNAGGEMYTAAKGLDIEGENMEVSTNPENLGLAGWGMSFDLGAEYRLKFDGFINGLNFSASVVDLGFVSYSKDAVSAYENNGHMDWTGMKISLEEGTSDDTVEMSWDSLWNLEEKGNPGSITRSSLPSFYIGVEMPFCNNIMSVGALYSGRASYHSLRNELTLSYNLNPTKWFAFGLNYSFINAVKTMGCIIEFTPRIGPCLYLGLDYMPMEWASAPEGFFMPVLPTESCLRCGLGLAFNLGGKKK